jgi:O-antigen/teichoic acid export membrane protein
MLWGTKETSGVNSMSFLVKLRHHFSRPLARSSLENLAIKALSIPVAIGVSAWLARILSIEEFGLYGVVLSLFMIGAMPVVSALSNLSIREIGVSLAAESRPAALGVMGYCLLSIGVAGTIFALVALLVHQIDMAPSHDATTHAFGLTVWLYPLFLLTAVGGAFLRGMHRVALGILPEQILRQTFFLLLLPLAPLAIGTRFDAAWAIQVQTSAMLGSALFALGFSWRVAMQQIGLVRPQMAWRRWNASLMPFLVLGFVQIGNSQMGMLALGLFNLNADAAYYRVADQLSGLAALPLLAVNFAVGPLLSRLRGGGDPAGIQASLASASKLVMLLTVPALLLLGLLPGPILALLFGGGYRAAAPLLVVLCIGAAFNAILGPVALALNMLGHERETLRGMRVALMVNVALALLLAPWLGGLGAAIAATVTKIVWNIVLFRCLHRLEGYSTLPFLIKPRIRTHEET